MMLRGEPRRRPLQNHDGGSFRRAGRGWCSGRPRETASRVHVPASALGLTYGPTQGASNSPIPNQSLRTCRRTHLGGGYPEDTAGTRAPRPSHRGPCPLQAATGYSNPSSNQHRGRVLHQPLWQSDAASPAVPSLLSPVPSTNPRPPPKELTDVRLPTSGPGQVPGKMQMSCASPPPLQGWAESQGHLQGPRPAPSCRTPAGQLISEAGSWAHRQVTALPRI